MVDLIKISGMRFGLMVGLLINSLTVYGQLFTAPVEGVYGQDYFINNYVDWQFAGIGDYQCGKKTYDGHAGTDFILNSFAQMDTGVAVTAVMPGRVFYVSDTLPDRNKGADTFGFGNYIGVEHPGKYQAYYAHIRKGSAAVAVGDSVTEGQVLAMIGNSGRSYDPHLHFELWYDSSYYIDPFAGPCGNASSYWKPVFRYRDSFRVIESGFQSGISTLNRLREREAPVATLSGSGFYDFRDTTADTILSYWALLHGGRIGDTLKADWLTKDDSLLHRFSYAVPYESYYFYFWSYPFVSEAELRAAGTLRFRLYRNDSLIRQADVLTADPTGITANEPPDYTLRQTAGRIVLEGLAKPTRIALLNMRGDLMARLIGRQCAEIETTRMPAGVYVLVIGRHREKIIIGH